MKYILGIDPSIRATGMAILFIDNKNNAAIVKSAYCPTTTEFTLEERIRIIVLEIKKFISDYPIELLAIENCFVGRNKKTSLMQAELIGTILYGLRYTYNTLIRLDATFIKSEYTADGTSDKENMIEETESRFLCRLTGNKAEREAKADAIACAYVGSFVEQKEE